jgi:uncharacterized protein
MTDLDRLDAFLSSDESPRDCMMLSDLDGFLHGIACTPVLVPTEEWIAVALGGEPDKVHRWVLDAIEALNMDIGEGLMSESPEVEPIFWQDMDGHVIATDWCEGFMKAVNLRADEWDRFMKTEEGAELMVPILFHMFDEEGNSMFGLPEEQVDEALARAAEVIAEVVPAIFALLRPRVEV